VSINCKCGRERSCFQLNVMALADISFDSFDKLKCLIQYIQQDTLI